MISRKPIEFDGAVVQVLDFSLMKTHEVKKVIADLFNDELVEDEVQHCLDLHALKEYLKSREA